jgi:Dipeptidyl aminopeptidases/acylaminoacyl-peptidases
VENVTTPTLFIHGVRDLKASIEESEEMVIGIIENTDTSVAFIRYPDEGHGIISTGENFIDRTYRVINWFDSYLKVGQ